MAGIFFRTLFIYLFLMTILRILGKRQIGELEVSELVSTLLLSELAALPIANPEIPILFAIVPIFLILSIEIILTFLKNKSPFLKKLFEPRPLFLIDRGNLMPSALTHARISVEELLGELRLQGVGDIQDVYYAILEESGQLSVLLKKAASPTTPDDLALSPAEKGIGHPLILDGVICEENLTRIGRDKHWLQKELSKRKATQDEVFLCTVNDAYEIYIKKRKE